MVAFLFRALLCDAIPNNVDDFFVVHLFKNTIAAHKEKIVIVLQFERRYFWFTDYALRVSSESCSFRFYITESSRDRQSSRKDSQRSHHVQIFITRPHCSFSQSLCPVHLASSSLNSCFLQIAVRLVISRVDSDLIASVHRHDSPAITNICHIGYIIDNHYNACAWTTAFNWNIINRIPLCSCLIILYLF